MFYSIYMTMMWPVSVFPEVGGVSSLEHLHPGPAASWPGDHEEDECGDQALQLPTHLIWHGGIPVDLSSK